MTQTSSLLTQSSPALTVVAGTSVGLIPWVKLLQTAVFCANVNELADELQASRATVLESIEALTLVETDTLGEVFRLRELASA
jgi:methylthioribose-1-phosphate isomerase